MSSTIWESLLSVPCMYDVVEAVHATGCRWGLDPIALYHWWTLSLRDM